MKNYKELGGLIGALVGCILTGVCVYLTGSVWSAVIPLVCLLFGGWIGKSIEKACHFHLALASGLCAFRQL